jgi:hypothetical protein
VSYDAGLLEGAEFYGVYGTNPDPWGKRRLRTGVLIQSGNGARHKAYEVFVKEGTNIAHFYRDDSHTWHRAGPVRSANRPWRDTFHDDVLDCPAAVQSTFNRNFELVYRSNAGDFGNQLRHIYFDQASGWWTDAMFFGPSRDTPPIGIPGFVQSNRGGPGDFEVVVVLNNTQAEHWTKHNSAPWTRQPGEWYRRERFGAGLAFGGPGLVQSKRGSVETTENGTTLDGSGDLHYVAADIDGHLQHYVLGSGSSHWDLVASFGDDVYSAPCLIEGTSGAHDDSGTGSLELCVAVSSGEIQHWVLYSVGGAPWIRLETFGANAKRVIGLIQSEYEGRLDVIVEEVAGRYRHYYLDAAGWNPGPFLP